MLWKFRVFIANALLILPIVFGCQQLAGQNADVNPPSGSELFKSKCSVCHDLERALNQYRSEDLWRSTISRMREEHGADLRREDVDQLVDYHVQRQQEEAAIFKEKCQQCHSGNRFLERKLTPDQARDTIKRMQQKAGNKIENKDIEVIVRYHTQAQQAALGESLRNVSRVVRRDQPLMMRGRAVFNRDCTSCHQISKTLGYSNDSKVWERTVENLREFSNDSISTRQIDDLADLHIEQQRKEIDAFKYTCTKCHDERRINQRSMSEEQWLATIRRMQQKAPELFSDEKVSLIAAYFHRRELALAKTFSGSCLDCHARKLSDPLQSGINQDSTVTDRELVTIHVERQKRDLELYESRCFVCHPDGISEQLVRKKDHGSIRTERDWVAFIAELQGVELNEVVEKEIGFQIEFHKSRH